MLNLKSIDIRIEYEPNDFALAWHLYRNSIGLTKLNRAFAALLLLVGIGAFFFKGPEWYVLLILAAGIEGWFDVIGEINWRTYYWRQKSMTQQPYNVRIDETGVTFRGTTLEAKRDWAGYKSFMEDESAFLLVIGKGLFSVYPKRAFRDIDQISLFRDFAREKIARQ